MKVLLLGKSGMLGSKFAELLQKLPEIDLFSYGKDYVDITNSSDVDAVFEESRPDFVINCAAYTAVDDCEKNSDIAFSINARAVGNIAKSAEKYDSILIHFSTDYVFDGNVKNGYDESAKPNPINAYGESKLEGERAIQNILEKYYIIRTSWLFGPNGKNFVDTMLKLAQKVEKIRVVNDQYGSPTYTVDLVEAVIQNFIDNKPQFGIYHLTNSGVCTWYEFAKEIFNLKSLPVEISAITSQEFITPAKRPSISILLNKKIPVLRIWQASLKDYLAK